MVYKEKEKEIMDSFMQTIVFAVIVAGAIFSAMWLILQDLKKGAHARISRLENVVDEMIRDCGKKKDQYITTHGFDRFETNINNRLDSMSTQLSTTNSRIDDLTKILLNKNGAK
jgi:hypothetical protein